MDDTSTVCAFSLALSVGVVSTLYLVAINRVLLIGVIRATNDVTLLADT